MSVEENKRIVRRFLELVNTGQIEALGEVIDVEFLDHGPGQGGGLAGLQRGLHMMHASLPNLHFGLDDIIAEGEMVVIRGNLSADFSGSPFFGVPATGQHAEWLSVMVMRVSGSKIKERWVNANTWGMLQQVGVIPQVKMDLAPLLLEDAGSIPVEELHKAVARQLIERVWVGRDLDALGELFTPDGGVAAGDQFLRPDVVKVFANMVFAAFPDFTATIEFIVAEGDTVVMRVEEGGTHEAEFMGVPATDKRVFWTEVFYLTMKAGKIEKVWMQPDTMGMMQKMSAFHPLVPAS
jgi:predicted ester cyclase